MPFTLTAQVRTDYPGTVRLGVIGDQNVTSLIYRVDGALPQQPVRNYATSGTGAVTVQDMEAPLGREVYYRLVRTSDNALLAQSNTVTCAAPADGRSLLRSVLKPSVQWMWAEPSDETGVRWRSSTTTHEVVGSDTPIIIGEVRQRRSGTLAFLCKSVTEADEMVALMRDGTPILLRNSPCSGHTLRDVLFYARDVNEVRTNKSSAWRTVVVEYQSSPFVPGATDEPPLSEVWDFAALRDSATNFAGLMASYETFGAMTLDMPSTRAAGESWSS